MSGKKAQICHFWGLWQVRWNIPQSLCVSSTACSLMDCRRVSSVSPGMMVSWKKSDLCCNNPQVAPVAAAYLLTCRLNVSGSSVCSAVAVNQWSSSPALAPVKDAWVWRGRISKYNCCCCESARKDMNKDWAAVHLRTRTFSYFLCFCPWCFWSSLCKPASHVPPIAVPIFMIFP